MALRIPPLAFRTHPLVILSTPPCHSERSEESVLPSRIGREILRHFVPQNDREYPLALRIPPLAFRTHPLVMLSTPPLVILSEAKNLFS